MSADYSRKGDEHPTIMPDQEDTHKAFKNKGSQGYKTRQVFKNYLTADAYADSLIGDVRLFKNVLFHIKEIGGTYAVKYNVLACLDGLSWKTLASDKVILASADATETLTDAWNFVKIQVASNVSGNAGKVNAFIGGKTP